jgi:hypothetical protein
LAKTGCRYRTCRDDAGRQFADLPEAAITVRPTPGAWSIKEIVGHLVDSSANNHQRFVRLQIAGNLIFPDYSQDNDAWVAVQHYQDAPWADLLALWRFYNRHLAWVVRTVDPTCLEHRWAVTEQRSMTLGELMTDYLRHLKDHLRQIGERLDAMR